MSSVAGALRNRSSFGTLAARTPAVAGGMVIVGDRNGAHLFAADAATGEKRWITQLDTHPAALITGSPIVAGERISEADALRLFETKDLNALGAIADFVNQRKNGLRASYIVNRYINY